MNENSKKNNNTDKNPNNNSEDHHPGTADNGLWLSKSKNSSNSNNINYNNKSNVEKSEVHPFDRISRYVFPSVYILFLIGYFASYTRDL